MAASQTGDENAVIRSDVLCRAEGALGRITLNRPPDGTNA